MVDASTFPKTATRHYEVLYLFPNVTMAKIYGITPGLPCKHNCPYSLFSGVRERTMVGGHWRLSQCIFRTLYCIVLLCWLEVDCFG